MPRRKQADCVNLDGVGRQQQAASRVSGAGVEHCRHQADSKTGESLSARASSNDGSGLVGLTSSA
ncbi:hypothetical protein ACLOJK_029468 [Asimina triloba]